jgi:hypothetical protein
MLKRRKLNTKFYTVSVRTFVIPFYYGSGSAKAKSYVSGSAILLAIPVLLLGFKSAKYPS